MVPLSVERGDFPEWLAMRQALYTGVTEAFHLQEMESIFTSPHMRCFLAKSEVGDDVIGLLELSLRNIVDGCSGSPIGYIEGLYIKPEFRGRGFGRALAAFAESWALGHGCEEIATDSELENTSAQGFFQGLDFGETWRIVQFKKILR